MLLSLSDKRFITTCPEEIGFSLFLISKISFVNATSCLRFCEKKHSYVNFEENSVFVMDS